MLFILNLKLLNYIIIYYLSVQLYTQNWEYIVFSITKIMESIFIQISSY